MLSSILKAGEGNLSEDQDLLNKVLSYSVRYKHAMASATAWQICIVLLNATNIVQWFGGILLQVVVDTSLIQELEYSPTTKKLLVRLNDSVTR